MVYNITKEVSNMDNLELINKMLYGDKYYNNLDLRYNKTYNILLSNNELEAFFDL